MTVHVPQLQPRPLLIVIAGPSGAGKSSLISGIRARRPNIVTSISVTTRAPRGQEQDGVDYYFVDPDRFAEMVEEGAFIEYAQVFGKHRYGTPRTFIDEQFAQGQSVIMDIDVQGAAQIRARMPESVQVFLTPPTGVILEQRLRGRGTDDDETIARRLVEAQRELERVDEFTYLIVNDEMDCAVDRLDHILAAEALRWRGVQPIRKRR